MEIFLILLVVFLIVGFVGAAKDGFKTPAQQTQEKFDAYEVKKSKWLAQVVDRNLEIELEDFVYRGDHAAVKAAIQEAYAEMPWKGATDYMGFTPASKEWRKEALRIMMARKGKLTSMDAEYGIQNSGFSAPTVKMMQEQNTATANFVIWIDGQLRQHGICEDLYIESGPNVAFLLTEPNKIRNGTYKWEPAISPVVNKSSANP